MFFPTKGMFPFSNSGKVAHNTRAFPTVYVLKEIWLQKNLLLKFFWLRPKTKP
jgi:hypothetical protein